MKEPVGHVTQIAVISDIHIDAQSVSSAEKYQRALTQIAALTGGKPDGILIVGDLAHRKNPEDIRLFKKTHESVFSPDAVATVHCYGDDHDFVWSDPQAADIRRLYHTILGDSYFIADVKASAPEGCRRAVISGIPVLSLDPCSRRPIGYTAEAKAWLRDNLKAITNETPDRYVIIITHPMIAGTVYGSELGGGAWATDDLSKILSAFPQALVFSGHLHFPLNDPRSIMQGKFTTVGTGAVSYLGIETDGFARAPQPTPLPGTYSLSQGLLTEFFPDGSVKIHRLDFAAGEEIETPWLLPPLKSDGSHLKVYTAERGDINHNAPPALSDFEVTKTENGILLAFSAGTDDEFVHHYVVSYGMAGEDPIRKRIVSDFLFVPKASLMKKQYEFSLEGLEPGKTYLISLTAFDSWNAQSQTLTKQVTI